MKQRRFAGLASGFAVAILLGAMPARSAAAMTCTGEGMFMVDPVVELISGPGDPVEEQMWWREQMWSGEYGAFIRDTSYVGVGETSYYLARLTPQTIEHVGRPVRQGDRGAERASRPS